MAEATATWKMGGDAMTGSGSRTSGSAFGVTESVVAGIVLWTVL
jgi:hypothetical protein